MVVWRYEDFFQVRPNTRSFIYEYQVCFAIISVHASNSTWTIRGRHLNHTQHVKTHTSGPKSGSCLPLCIPTTNTPPIGCTKTMRPRNAPFREDGSGLLIRISVNSYPSVANHCQYLHKHPFAPFQRSFRHQTPSIFLYSPFHYDGRKNGNAGICLRNYGRTSGHRSESDACKPFLGGTRWKTGNRATCRGSHTVRTLFSRRSAGTRLHMRWCIGGYKMLRGSRTFRCTFTVPDVRISVF